MEALETVAKHRPVDLPQEAVSGVLRDATGAWSAAVFLDAGLIACAVVLFLFVREAAKSRVLGRAEARDTESRLGPRVRPSQRTAV